MKKYLILLIGPLLFALILLSPLKFSDPKALSLLAIFVWVICWWLAEVYPLHITGLLGVCLTIFMQVSSSQEAFAPFANPLIFLFMGSFLFSKAFQKFELDQSFGQIILANSWLRKKPKRIFMAILILTAFLSSWMSNSATTVLMLSLVLGLCQQLIPNHKEAQSYVLLGVAYAASIGGLLTPVGSPPNLIAIGFLDSVSGIKINFLEWILYAAPLVFSVMGLLLYWVMREIPELEELSSYKKSHSLIHFSKDQKKVLFLLSLLVFFWVFPSAMEMFFEGKWTAIFNEGAVAIFFALLLFLIPKEEGGTLLNWEEGSRIDWGTLLLFGSGLSLGGALFKTKLAEDFAKLLHFPQDQVLLAAVFLLLIIYAAIFFSEIASNTAAANIVLPLILSLSIPETALTNSLAVCFGLSLAFMLPVGTPPNAIVYGTGLIKSKDMLKFGFKLNMASGAFIFVYILLLKYFLKLT